MARQLDMLKAEVVPFPFDRRWREVQGAARFINVVSTFDNGQEGVDQWWGKKCAEMAKRLRKAGVGETEIRFQLLTFENAVQAALRDLPPFDMASALQKAKGKQA